MCKAVLNENALLSVFFTFNSVERLLVFSVTCKTGSMKLHHHYSLSSRGVSTLSLGSVAKGNCT